MQKKINKNLIMVTPISPFYKNEALVIGIIFLLPGDQTSNPTQYMNDFFYGNHDDGVASSGHFHYLPLNPINHNDDFFMRALSSMENNSNSARVIVDEMKAAYAARVNLVDGNTKIELLINIEVQESVDEEISAIEEDLNEFVSNEFCVSWEQIKLGQA